MLKPNQPLVIYADKAMDSRSSKMAEGVIRYSANPIVAVIDSNHAGKTVGDVWTLDSDIPVVANLQEALAKGPEVLVLGTAPSGGRIPQEWMSMLSEATGAGLSIISGMHDSLKDMMGDQLKDGQWIWDVRIPVGDPPPIASAQASKLNNTRLLLVGTDMAVGKMTAGLEIYKCLQERGKDTAFLATGQIGISIMGSGIPLDAIRLDYTSAYVEQMVMGAADNDIVIVEGQGSLIHPGSTATLPLMRGSCCNAMILCHRAGMEKLRTVDKNDIAVPPLSKVIELNEMVAAGNGNLTPAKVIAIAVNTSSLDADAARDELKRISDETGLPTVDPVRDGADVLADAVLSLN